MTTKEIPALAYRDRSDYVAPTFAGERDLQTVTAEPFLKISDEGIQLEGLCFDRQGNLYMVEVFGGRILKVTFPERKVSTILGPNNDRPAAVKIHKDGRLFVCCLGDFESTGCIFAINPDGSRREIIIPESTDYCIDDMVFDRKGGFYFTDFRGYSTNPIGGVYYVSPGSGVISPVMRNVAVANGVALSTDEKILWVTETNANRLHRIELMEDRVTIAPFGASIPYHFTGYLGPDSCCIDRDDNLYVAMYEQGRVMVLNRNGYPIGQILLPGREEGHMLRSTHPAFIPGTDKLVICSNDADGGRGSWLYIARGVAEGHSGYQFQE